jgi:hypothetical protein
VRCGRDVFFAALANLAILTAGFSGWSALRSEDFSTAGLAHFLPYAGRSNSFPLEGNSYRAAYLIALYFYEVTNGMPFALYENRRSGAQRGAPENNFGQRFSVGTPCF